MPGSYSALTVAASTAIAATWGNNVRDSAITQHATYAALNSAITSPQKGMVAYLADTDTYWYYRGTNWRLLPGQELYAKWDVSTSFFTNVAPAYVTVFTSATFNIPSSGVGQAFEINYQCPHSSGAGTVTRYNSQLAASVNAGAFNVGAYAGPIYVNSVADSYITRGAWIYKAAGADTTMALRVLSAGLGGNFDCIAGVDKPFALTMKTTGLLSSEVS